jgi:hypothetical protein
VRYAVRMAFARCGLDARYTGTHVLRRTMASGLTRTDPLLLARSDPFLKQDLKSSGRVRVCRR